MGKARNVAKEISDLAFKANATKINNMVNTFVDRCRGAATAGEFSVTIEMDKHLFPNLSERVVAKMEDYGFGVELQANKSVLLVTW